MFKSKPMPDTRLGNQETVATRYHPRWACRPSFALAIIFALTIVAHYSAPLQPNAVFSKSATTQKPAPESQLSNTTKERWSTYLPLIAQSGTTYYIDCIAGNDTASGTSPAQAWQSLAKGNSAALDPGDSLLLKRGCTWTGPLEAKWSGTADKPILISAYGSGDLPMIQDAYAANVRITGSHLIIEYLQTTLSTPPNPDYDCNGQPVAWKPGFSFTSEASHNTLQYSKATKQAIGIFLENSSHHNKVLHNILTDNNVLWILDVNQSLGAMGILVHGNDNEIAYNYFENNMATCNYNGIVESNSIELYGAKRNAIHHNIAFNDRVFSELGSSATSQAEDNVYAYNVHTTSFNGVKDDPTNVGARFIITRGEGHQFGPVWRTRVYNNTVYYTGEDSAAIVCQYCSANVLTLKNNIILVMHKAVYVGPDNFSQYQPDESHNIYWHPDGLPFPSNFLQNLTIASTSQTANPELIDPTTDPTTYNFRLKASSPAIDKGTSGSGYNKDLDGLTVPQGTGYDVGAYEFPP